MTNKPMLSVERELILFAILGQIDAHRPGVEMSVRKELRALLDNPVEDVDDEQWYADTPDGDSALVTRVGALTEWQKGRDGMRAERDAALSELAELKAAQHKGEPVGCRYRKTDRPDRCWTYCEGVKATPWKGWEVQPLFVEQPATAGVLMPDNLTSHRNSWLQALARLIELEPATMAPDSDEKAYWQHERQAMLDMYVDLDKLNGLNP